MYMYDDFLAWLKILQKKSFSLSVGAWKFLDNAPTPTANGHEFSKHFPVSNRSLSFTANGSNCVIGGTSVINRNGVGFPPINQRSFESQALSNNRCMRSHFFRANTPLLHSSHNIISYHWAPAVNAPLAHQRGMNSERLANCSKIWRRKRSKPEQNKPHSLRAKNWCPATRWEVMKNRIGKWQPAAKEHRR